MKRNVKNWSTILQAAMLPAAAAMVAPLAASAAPVIIATVTDLGPAENGSGVQKSTTLEAYDITLSTTDGGVITAVDLGQTANGTNGIYYTGASGGFLQESTFNAGTSSQAGTPDSPTKNNAGGASVRSASYDTHILFPTADMAPVTSPYENSDYSNPVSGSNSAGDTTTGTDFGYGTYLHAVFGVLGANQSGTLDLAYLVMPKAAGTATLTASVQDSADAVATLVTAVIPSGVTTSAPKPIVSLTAQGSQTIGGTSLPLLHVVGANGSYVLAHDSVANLATANAEVTGFSPATDAETYALKLSGSPTPTQIATIIADINLSSATDGVLALPPTPDVAAIAPGYQIELTATTSKSADQNIGFDFSQETNVPGMTVTDVIAVPEPASIGLLMGASGLLLGRRKRKA